MVTLADKEQVHGSTALPDEREALVPIDRVVPHPMDDESRRGVSVQEHCRIVLRTVFHQPIPDLQVYPRAAEAAQAGPSASVRARQASVLPGRFPGNFSAGASITSGPAFADCASACHATTAAPIDDPMSTGSAATPLSRTHRATADRSDNIPLIVRSQTEPSDCPWPRRSSASECPTLLVESLRRSGLPSRRGG